MSKVSVNAPKTPVTEGSNGIAAATLPNICKMPGPPAPFVPTPLPNIGKSGTNPKGYSTTVTIEGKKVAIKGASFGSMGDVASKGTGGGLISSNVEGPTSFVGPGSMDVKIEGKNVQLLGDPMLNNCGPGGSPANAATMTGLLQQPSGLVKYVTGEEECPLCKKIHGSDAALEETQATQDSAQRLVDHLTAQKYANTTMLGVVQCKCPNRYYADHSGAKTDPEFCTHVEKLGWHGPLSGNAGSATGSDNSATKNDNNTEDHPVRAFIKKRFKGRPEDYEDYKAQVDIQWETAAKRSRDYNEDKTLPAAYPAGSCAAPKILVRVMQDRGYPASISEKWFHKRGKGNPTGGKEKQEIGRIKYDEQAGEIREKGKARKFDHGETVPPCETCNILLPMLLCPDGQVTECLHGAKDVK